MVERPADVLPMDRTAPPVLSTFTRADTALRRMPGLGILIVLLLIRNEWERGNVIGFSWLAIGAVCVLAIEFLPKR